MVAVSNHMVAMSNHIYGIQVCISKKKELKNKQANTDLASLSERKDRIRNSIRGWNSHTFELNPVNSSKNFTNSCSVSKQSLSLYMVSTGHPLTRWSFLRRILFFPHCPATIGLMTKTNEVGRREGRDMGT